MICITYKSYIINGVYYSIFLQYKREEEKSSGHTQRATGKTRLRLGYTKRQQYRHPDKERARTRKQDQDQAAGGFDYID